MKCRKRRAVWSSSARPSCATRSIRSSRATIESQPAPPRLPAESGLAGRPDGKVVDQLVESPRREIGYLRLVHSRITGHRLALQHEHGNVAPLDHDIDVIR